MRPILMLLLDTRTKVLFYFEGFTANN